MKYTANLVKAVLRAMQNHPVHTFWDCAIATELDDRNFAVVTCTNGDDDGHLIEVHILDNVVYCYLKKQNGDAKWFEMWYSDKKAMISTMISNMAADLNAGYDLYGKSITEQRQMIVEYQKAFEDQLDAFKTMDDEQVNRWCFYDMKKRGVIE